MKIFNFQFLIFKQRQGFTVVELIVAMSVFLILMTVATGSFVSAIRSQRAATAFMGVNNNASLVLEEIAREIRTGHSFVLAGDEGCGNGGQTGITFTDFSSSTVLYTVKDGVILKQKAEEDLIPVTASTVNVERLCFMRVDVDPWRVTVLLTAGLVHSTYEGQKVNIQTTISSRILPRDI